jgi:hypothetical protein
MFTHLDDGNVFPCFDKAPLVADVIHPGFVPHCAFEGQIALITHFLNVSPLI